jgi:hypothetical protein
MRFAHLLLALAALTGFSVAQNANFQTDFAAGPRYLSLNGPDFLRPIATPTVSLDAPLPPISSLPQIGPAVVDQAYVANPELAHQADLFPIYYGYAPLPVLVLAGSGPSEVPESIAGDGATRLVSVEALRQAGYGVSVGEHAAYLKTHEAQAGHVYTNDDLQRLHQ